MTSYPAPVLHLPTFLHGTFTSVHRKVRREGQRCAEHYRKSLPFPTPAELRAVAPGEVVLTHEAADLVREQPAWRLHPLSGVLSSLCEALDWQNAFQVSDLYEASCRETPWGALYFVTSGETPHSAERTALRLQAVLRFWDSLQTARYLYKRVAPPLSLDELLSTACDWALEAWGPSGESSVRGRLEAVAERMACATREDCIEAILRQLPRALPFARGLKHSQVLSTPDFWRERLTQLAPEQFERLSGACTAELLGQLHDWDLQLAAH